MSGPIRLAATFALAMVTSGAAIAQDDGVNVVIEGSGSSLRLPADIAADVCGLDADTLARDFTGTDQVACEITQDMADQGGLGEYTELIDKGSLASFDADVGLDLDEGLDADVAGSD